MSLRSQAPLILPLEVNRMSHPRFAVLGLPRAEQTHPNRDVPWQSLTNPILPFYPSEYLVHCFDRITVIYNTLCCSRTQKGRVRGTIEIVSRQTLILAMPN
jgi:hypothetical protein